MKGELYSILQTIGRNREVVMSRSDRKCLVCKQNFAECKHSISDEEQKIADNHIRAIVQDELKKRGL